jgi:hypothetical protein
MQGKEIMNKISVTTSVADSGCFIPDPGCFIPDPTFYVKRGAAKEN